MTRHRTFKVWIGVGAAALLGSTAAGIAAPTSATGTEVAGEAAAARSFAPALPGGTAAMPMRIAASGEGGEAGSSEASGLDPRVQFLRDMGLIAGQVMMADELAAASRWEDAAVQLRHAAEAIYPRVARAIKRHELRRLDTPLKALAKAADDKDKEAYAAARTTLEARITAADAAVQRNAKPWTRFVMQGVMEILRNAATEYEESIDQGRIANVEEYQTGRGFILSAAKLVADAAADLEKVDPKGTAAVRAGLQELLKAWPGSLPPAVLVKDHSAVLADISRIELAASTLLNK